MPREAAERLLGAGNGDAALLYLCLLSRGEASSLHWGPDRLQNAYAALLGLDMVDPAQPVTPAANTPPEPDSPPDYSAGDLAMAMEKSSPFSWLVEETQRRLGKVLSSADLRTLYTIYDYLGLPTEVILLLTNWCMEKTAKKYGPGRKPTLNQIKREAFSWHRQGVDTLEAAEGHVARLARRSEGAVRLLSLVGITGRGPVTEERRYLEAWSDLGFADDAIRLAYEKTLLKKQSMNWPYMNSILKSWHQKGLHTKGEVLEKEKGWQAPAAPGQSAFQPAQDDRARQEMDWMDQFLAAAGSGKEE